MKFRLCMMAAALLCGSMIFGQTPLVSSHASSVNNPAPSALTAAMKPAVRVNGAVLTEADVVREMYTIFPYANQHGGFPKALEADIRKGAIDMIIFEELLYQESKRMKIPIASDQLSKAEAAFRKQLGSSAYEEFLRTDCQGSKQVLREKIRRSLLIEKMIATEVDQKSIITEVAAKDYYDKNPKQFEIPESLSIQTISIIPPQNGGVDADKEARRRAEEVYKLAAATKSYQDFGLLAEKKSDDDWHVNMGDRKSVEVSKLPPPVVQAAAEMKPGEVSKLIQLGNAYTIFRLVEHTRAGRTPFAAVKARLQTDLQKQKRVELRAALNQKLRKNAKIEVL
ncbi:MAG TPA: peptidyl-prolyl cis-trans isomerase [Acidobacteriota bacterium]|nr:peptidyl-prolyl cis-trans isomerase [Acidobacteriota bacterium]